MEGLIISGRLVTEVQVSFLRDHTKNFISIPNELKAHNEHKASYYYFSHNIPQQKPTDVIPYQSTKLK